MAEDNWPAVDRHTTLIAISLLDLLSRCYTVFITFIIEDNVVFLARTCGKAESVSHVVVLFETNPA